MTLAEGRPDAASIDCPESGRGAAVRGADRRADTLLSARRQLGPQDARRVGDGSGTARGGDRICAESGDDAGDRLLRSGTDLWIAARFGSDPAGNDQCGRFPIALQEFGVALSESEFDANISQALGPVARMEIGNHALDLNVGVAVLWFIEHVILPQRLEVNSFGELLGLVIPCDAVGELAADYLSGIPFLGFAVAPFVEEACQSGLEAAGNFLTRQLAESLDVSTFQMSGECKLRDTNGDRTIDKLEEGRWTQGFQGDFRGERR